MICRRAVLHDGHRSRDFSTLICFFYNENLSMLTPHAASTTGMGRRAYPWQQFVGEFDICVLLLFSLFSTFMCLSLYSTSRVCQLLLKKLVID